MPQQGLYASSDKIDWNLLYWLLGGLFFPIAFPLVVLNLWSRVKVHRSRNSLSGKVVLISGASSGLGEALAHVFYNAGCKVILAARRITELERVKSDLLASDTNLIAYPPTVLPLDLAKLNELQDFVAKALGVHNQIDILINNGGISVRADVLSTSIEVDLRVMLINYFGAVALTKAVLPSMVMKESGKICFISSVQGKFSLPHRSSYSASKHALQAFADSLRAEIAHKRVKVSCISPGYIRTELSANALTGNGEPYGKMDTSTATGMAPDQMAHKILEAILHNSEDVIISDLEGKIAYCLRFLCPSFYFWLMEKRALKIYKSDLLAK